MGALRSLLLAVVAATATLGVTAANAGAAVRTATISDGLDKQDTSPGFTSAPVVTEVVGAVVTYDDVAGVITASVTYNSNNWRPLSLSLHRSCGNELSSESGWWDSLLVSLASDADDNTGEEYVELTRPGWRGSLRAQRVVSADGSTVSTRFEDPTLRNLDARCVIGGANTSNGGVDDYSGYFAGFEPATMSRSTAEEFANDELARRFGDAWTATGAKRWLLCPRKEMITEADRDESNAADTPPTALCEFRVPTPDGSQTRAGDMSLQIVDGKFSVDSFHAGKPFDQRRCSIRSALRSSNPPITGRSLRASGYVGCYDGGMVSDLHFLKPGRVTVALHGTNRAGFEAAALFRCRLRARAGGWRTAACTNALGDRFTYRFRLGKRQR